MQVERSFVWVQMLLPPSPPLFAAISRSTPFLVLHHLRSMPVNDCERRQEAERMI